MTARPRILVIDNYDSFTYNLVHLLEQLDVYLEVKRNDEVSLDEVGTFSHILISPGPGVPEEAGVVPSVIEAYGGSRSILGVCLGFQCLLESRGAKLENMPRVQHGAQDRLKVNTDSVLFWGLPSEVSVGRYHSWACRPDQVPSQFRITATSEDGFVMAIEHEKLPLYGVQFHPESIMTEHGLAMVENWIGLINIQRSIFNDH